MQLKELTDENLLILLAEGKKNAFSEIYRRYAFKLFSIAYNQIGIQEEAEELVQDIFLNLWKRHSELNIRNLDIYLTISVKNRAYDYFRSQINFRKYQEFVIFKEIYENNETDVIVNFNELTAAVEKALGQLPEKTAEVFRKSRFENQSVKDIASSLALSEKAVEYHISKSLKHLRVHLQEYRSDN